MTTDISEHFQYYMYIKDGDVFLEQNIGFLLGFCMNKYYAFLTVVFSFPLPTTLQYTECFGVENA